MATPNTTTEIERLIGRVETLEELVEYARTQDELERLRRSLAVAKSLVEHAKAINERWRECSMAHDDDDAPFVLVCPKCQSPNVGVADNVPPRVAVVRAGRGDAGVPRALPGDVLGRMLRYVDVLQLVRGGLGHPRRG
jgi:hypothetical protein